MKSLEKAIKILTEVYEAEITKGDYYYNVVIWDSSEGCIQDMNLTEDEVINLLKYIKR